VNGEEKDLSKLLEGILGQAKSPEAARSALAQLFPKVEKVLRTYVPRHSNDRNERRRQRRLSEKDFAAAYFRLDPQPASWSRSEIDSILNSTSPTEALSRVESRLSAAAAGDRPRLRRLFLDALDGAFSVLRPFNLDWLRALLDVAPSFVVAGDEAKQAFYVFDNGDRVRWLLIHALETLLPENRAQLMLGVIPQVADISIICDVFRAIAGDLQEEGAKGQRETASFRDSGDIIRRNLLVRVRQLAETNQIWSQF
jgi:hypothetical protein